MKVYLGQTRSKKLIQQLTLLGFGECCVREEFPPRRVPYLLDNGAYKDFTRGEKFDGDKWAKCLTKLHASKIQRPDFIVCPDIVAGGMESLTFSKSHVFTLRFIAPVYLAVQDGMNGSAVGANMHLYSGIFVGGSSQWKERTGRFWVELAHSLGKPCHIGRVGTVRKVLWARAINADSIDSSFPLWSAEHLEAFVDVLKGEYLPKQGAFLDERFLWDGDE